MRKHASVRKDYLGTLSHEVGLYSPSRDIMRSQAPNIETHLSTKELGLGDVAHAHGSAPLSWKDGPFIWRGDGDTTRSGLGGSYCKRRHASTGKLLAANRPQNPSTKSPQNYFTDKAQVFSPPLAIRRHLSLLVRVDYS